MTRLMLMASLLAMGQGCVIGRAERPSLAESAQGPTASLGAGSPVTPHTSPDNGEAPSPSKPPSPDSVWAYGYWHWDGVRYTWQRGHWDRR